MSEIKDKAIDEQNKLEEERKKKQTKRWEKMSLRDYTSITMKLEDGMWELIADKLQEGISPIGIIYALQRISHRFLTMDGQISKKVQQQKSGVFAKPGKSGD